MGKVYDKVQETLINYGNEDDMTLDLAKQVDELKEKEITTPLQAFQEFYRLVNEQFENSNPKLKRYFQCWDNTEAVGGQRVFSIIDGSSRCDISFDIKSGNFIWHSIDYPDD